MPHLADSRFHLLRRCIFLGFLLFHIQLSYAQRTVIKGVVTDSVTNEPLAFANILFPGSTTGTTTDFDGHYTLETSKNYTKLEARYLGYHTIVKEVQYGKSQVINFRMKATASTLQEVVVKSAKQKYRNKNNPAVDLIENVIANKKRNRKGNFDYYEYEKYQKLEFALSNISEKFRNKKIFNKFQFVFDNLDSSKMNGKPLLPMYLKENISEVWYRKEPRKMREVVKAEKFVNFSKFVDDQSLSEYFQYLYQDIDIYEDNISLLGHSFLSPIANFSPTFYRFYILDTVLIDQDSCFKVAFYPRNKSDFLFQGDLYVTKDSVYAVKLVEMSVNREINLNWVKDLAIRQKFRKADTLGYILEKDEIMADFGISAARMGIFGQRSVSYRNLKFNQPRKDTDYEGETLLETADYRAKSDSFWLASRHDSLTQSEAGVYTAMDSLQKLPSFRMLLDIATLVFAGYKIVGPMEIGPVNTFYSFNPVEGFRLRFGGRTTAEFSSKFRFETYAAYGFKDEKWKYYFGTTFSFAHNPISVFPVKQLRMSYQKDTKIPGQELQFVQEDNFLLSFKRGDNNKWLYNEIIDINYLNEFRNHTSVELGLKHWTQHPAGDLFYNKVDYLDTANRINTLRTMELGLTLRWAPHEQFYQGKLYRKPLPNKYPIFTISYDLGLKDVLDGQYDFHRLTASLYKRIYLSQFGYLDATIEGGKIFGTVPYPLLFVHRANQTFSFQLQSYNLMNFLEFVSDQYYALHLQYYMNGYLFNRIPLLKELKWREVMSFKMLSGRIQQRNDPDYNGELFKFPENSNHTPITYSLEQKPYMEASVGLYNVLKFFRIDYVVRLSYLDHPVVSKSGLRFRVKFEF